MYLKLGSRKVQVINGSCFICLPKAWAKSFGLEKGKLVSVELADDGSLKISSCKGD